MCDCDLVYCLCDFKQLCLNYVWMSEIFCECVCDCVWLWFCEFVIVCVCVCVCVCNLVDMLLCVYCVIVEFYEYVCWAVCVSSNVLLNKLDSTAEYFPSLHSIHLSAAAAEWQKMLPCPEWWWAKHPSRSDRGMAQSKLYLFNFSKGSNLAPRYGWGLLIKRKWDSLVSSNQGSAVLQRCWWSWYAHKHTNSHTHTNSHPFRKS